MNDLEFLAVGGPQGLGNCLDVVQNEGDVGVEVVWSRGAGRSSRWEIC